MHRTKIVMSSLAVVGLVLAGCSTGGDDDATSPQASTGGPEPITTPSDESPSEDDDDEGGEASGDLVAWAGDFCGAIAPLEAKFAELENFTPEPADPSDTGAIFDQLRATFADIAPVFEEAREAVEGVGVPPIDDGEQLYDNMVNVLGTASEVFGQVDEALANVDPDDPDALNSIAPLFEDIGAEFEAAGTEIEAAFDRPEMKAAFEAAPECEGLDLGSE